jgi:hypothetical protein
VLGLPEAVMGWALPHLGVKASADHG